MSWKVSFRVFKTLEHCGKVREKVEFQNARYLQSNVISDNTSRKCSVSSAFFDRFDILLHSI